MKYFINSTIIIIAIVCCSSICEAAPLSPEAADTKPEETHTKPEAALEVNSYNQNNLSFDIFIVFVVILMYCFFRFCALNSCYGCFNRSMIQDEHIPLLKKHEIQRLRSRLFLFEDKEQPAVLAVY